MLLIRLTLLACVLALCFGTSGCVAGKQTTTDRTAVEVALLSHAAERTLRQMDKPEIPYKTFYLETSGLALPDKEHVTAATRLQMMKLAMQATEDKEKAEVIVYPRVLIAGIDEGSTLIGIPAFPVIIPGAGTITTPELAFFKRASQRAHNKMGIYGVNAKDSSLTFDLGTKAGSASYVRWTVLFFITFATTDLPVPYHTTKKWKEPTYGESDI